jgi:serine/threonine-protein kinase HipA
MARKPAHAPLDVYLNGRLIGRLRREPSGAVEFRYAAEWLAWENAIPVSLSLPLREDRYTGAPVLAVFDNLLPDDASIRRTVAERTGAAGTDPYSLLAAIGRDCANLAHNPLGLGRDREFRISLAGAQEKTALLHLDGKWHVPHGTTPTTHILKPQLGVLPNGIDMSHSVENEHFCMGLASGFGLPVAKTQVLDFAGRRVLAVERFDRLWTRDKRLLRIPQEDMCQALSIPPSRKYQSDGGPGIRQVLELLKGSDAPEEDRRTFLKAQLFFWLIGATDGHAKNFSVRLSPGGRFRLTPLYDILSVQPAFDARQIQKKSFRLAMSVGDKRHYVMDTIAPRHFEQDGDAAGLPAGSVDTIIEKLLDAATGVLERAVKSEPTVPALAKSIVAGVQARLRLIEIALNAKTRARRSSSKIEKGEEK